MLISGRSLLAGVMVVGFGGSVFLWLASLQRAGAEDFPDAGVLLWLARVALNYGIFALLLWFAANAVTDETERSLNSLAAEQRQILEKLASLERSLAEHAAATRDTVEAHREATTDVDPGHLRP